MAVFLDPAGAFFGVWQPGTHTGSELVDQAGTQSWVVLPLTTFDGGSCAIVRDPPVRSSA